ncbi:MAG: transcriptional repressor, partial [Sedimenticolaceae bacterium]
MIANSAAKISRNGAFVQDTDIKKAGLKVTLPRVKILEVFESEPDAHMTAEDVYKLLMERGE